LEAERRAYLEAHADQVDENGRRLVVGGGHARPREVTTAAGRVEVTAPRVDDRRDGEKFTSAILPPYMRKSPKVAEVLPILYLRGIPTGDFAPALEGFFGSSAGLSPSTVQRLTESWRAELADWAARDLSEVDYVYVWAETPQRARRQATHGRPHRQQRCGAGWRCRRRCRPTRA
jgi:transposase-like protein